MTALMVAAQEDDATTVQKLLAYGANPRLRDKEQGLTAEERAQRFSCEDVVELFRTGHVPAKIAVNSKLGRVQVDADHWLVRTPLARKDDPESSDYPSEEVMARRVYLVDKTGHEGNPVITHVAKRNPQEIFAFRDVDGRYYVCMSDSGAEPYYRDGYVIYLVKAGDLFKKWAACMRFGLSCMPLRKGGALIRAYEPGHYEYGWQSPRTNDGVVSLSRFRHGVIEELGNIETPSQ